MPARLRATPADDVGFTLIELLVVMVILAVLAGIAIPVFLNQRRNGYNTAVRSDLANAGLALDSAAADTGGDVSLLFATGKGHPGDPVSTDGLLVAATFLHVPEFRGTATVSVSVAADVSSADYCLYAENSANPGTFWVFSKRKGGLQAASFSTAALASAACA